MKFLPYAAIALSLFAGAWAQEDNDNGDDMDQSLCDKYTTALLQENNATNQLTVLTLVVNTALIGNYPNPAGEPKNNVTGILNPGMYNGEMVNLLPYFNGGLKSTNRNGQASSVNFLDGGGAAPLMQNKAANDMSSNQYMLVTHLYQLFGSLLGCSLQNASSPFKNYQGNPSMSQVHRFMNLNQTQNNYFIEQVGLSAASFGVSQDDVTTVANTLNTTFNYRCLPPKPLTMNATAYSQSCCLAPECPVMEDARNCTQTAMSYPNGTEGMEPAVANTATASNGSSSSGSSSGGSSGGSNDNSSGGTNGADGHVVNIIGALALAAAGLVAVGI